MNGGEDEEEKFFRHIVRGYYLPEDNALYCFKENDFAIDAEIRESAIEPIASDNAEITDTVIRNLSRLKEMLHLKDDTKIFLGPKRVEPTTGYPKQKYIGTIESVLHDRHYKRKTEIQYGDKE